MEYLQTLCFAGVNSKRRDFQQERRKEKKAIAAVYVAIEICVSRQLPSNYQRNSVATTFPVVQHQNLIVDN